MSDLRQALDDICRLCNESRTYTRRTQVIHEVAMKGLGMTGGQRRARHIAVFERTGDHPGLRAYNERAEKRRLKREQGETA